MQPGTRRRHLLVAVGATLVTVLSACSMIPGLDDPLADARAAADRIATALAEGSLDSVTLVPGSAPEGGADVRRAEVFAGLDGLEPGVRVTGVEPGEVDDSGEMEQATATLAWTWPLEASPEPWRYTVTATLRRTPDEQWALAWDPAVLAPSLADGEVLDTDPLAARRGDILGGGGEPLVTLREVVRFGIDKSSVSARAAVRDARRLAEALDIEVGPYADRVRAAGERAFVEALVLRRPQAEQALAAAARIAGAAALGTRLPLAPTRRFAAPLLGEVGEVTAAMIEESGGELSAGDVVGTSGLQARYQEQLAGTPGLVVQAVSPDGEERDLHTVPPTPGTPLRTTLSRTAQSLAEEILADVGPASALVALRPSDGALLAAASGPGSEGLHTATYGRYPPGSTFKVVTALALLRSGLRPGSPVQCSPTVTVDGKQFKNYDGYPPGSLGRIPLAEAIAQSCNTALINARDRLADGELAEAAAALGLGVDHDLGFPAYFGQVPEPRTATGAAAALIGQGRVLASPLVMATVMASVVEGRTVLPVLLPDHEVERTAPAAPLRGKEAAALRRLLRGVVERGSGAGLADVPGPPVLAKTGTAEYLEGGRVRTHVWMIAAQGDLAVAAFVATGASGSGTAGPLLEEFLRGMRGGVGG